MKKKTKIANTLLCTLAIMGTISLTNCPKSHSFFISDNNESPLTYKASVVKNSYSDRTIFPDYENSTIKEAKFNFKFKPSQDKENSYIYKIEYVPPDCTVTTNPNSLNFEKGSDRSDVDVSMTCSVQHLKSENDLKLNVTISEKLNDEKDFNTFNTLHYNESYASYLNKLPTEVLDEIEIDIGGETEVDVYKEFIDWITAYANRVKNGDYLEQITKYVDHTFDPSNKDEFNANIKTFIGSNNGGSKSYFDIPGIGIKVTGEDASKKVTFAIQENMLGYARTYYLNSATSPDANIVYFYLDTKVANVQNRAFNLYLEKYIYPTDTENRQLISTYVGNISDHISSDGSIHGIDGIYPVKISDGYYRINKTAIRGYALADTMKDNKFSYVMDQSDYDISLYIRPILENIVDENKKRILSKTAIDKILDDYFMYLEESKIFASLMTGTNDIKGLNDLFSSFDLPTRVTEARAFKDYFIYKDPEYKHYVLFKIWSDDGVNTNVQVFKIESATNMNIKFDNIVENDREVLEIAFTYKTSQIDESNSTDINNLIDTFKQSLEGFNKFLEDGETLNITTNDISDYDTVTGSYKVTLKLEKKVTKTNIQLNDKDDILALKDDTLNEETKINGEISGENKIPLESNSPEEINKHVDGTVSDTTDDDNRELPEESTEKPDNSDTSTEVDSTPDITDTNVSDKLEEPKKEVDTDIIEDTVKDDSIDTMVDNTVNITPEISINPGE